MTDANRREERAIYQAARLEDMMASRGIDGSIFLIELAPGVFYASWEDTDLQKPVVGFTAEDPLEAVGVLAGFVVGLYTACIRGWGPRC